MGSKWTAAVVLSSSGEDEDGSLVLRRIREAIGLIERSAGFECDSELAAAHLALTDAATHLSELFAAHAVKSGSRLPTSRLPLF